MPLAVFDVTKSYAKIGELFDSSKKYVYKDPGSGVLASPIREPSYDGTFLYSGSYYWREFESYTGQATTTVFWAGTVESVAGSGIATFNNTGSPYQWVRGSLQSSSTSYDNPASEPDITSIYSIARLTYVNANVIRMPHLWTLYNTSNSLTYSFDGESFTVGPSPPALPPTSPSPRLFYLGII